MLVEITNELTFDMLIIPAYPSLVIILHAYGPEHLIINSAGPSACAMQTYITGGMQAYQNGQKDIEVNFDFEIYIL